LCVTCAVTKNSADDLILPLAIINRAPIQTVTRKCDIHVHEMVSDNDDLSRESGDCNVNVITRSGLSMDTDVRFEYGC